MRKEKFASEIFGHWNSLVYAAMQKKIHVVVRRDVKPMTDQQVQGEGWRPARRCRVDRLFELFPGFSINTL